MRIRRLLLAIGACTFAALLPSTAALAEDGNGESFCSSAGAPAGFDGDFDPFPNNPGEVIAWIAQNIGNAGDSNPGNPPYVPYVVGCHPTVQ